ncbi:MAG: NlpC/P60 family protein [Desulfopila sp.]|nr:NlpC/P60 family protein [Desulfopila sp.]
MSLLFFSSCSKAPVHPPFVLSEQPKHEITNIPITTKLYDYYNTWQGTPYRNGGLSRNGIDCSGLVYLFYRRNSGVELPRTSRSQSKLGEEISLFDLQPGDLVFFNTGWFTHHVGIYIENDQFLHSSTQRGVTISSLKEYYWKQAFYLAKRIDIP